MRVREGQFFRFGEYLATHVDLDDATAQSVARELDLPYTTLVEWWRHLEYHRAIHASSNGMRVDRPRLMSVLTAHRMPRLTPVAQRTTSLDARGLSRFLQDRQIPHALAILSAANEWAFFEPQHTVQVYVPRRHLSALRGISSEHPGNVSLEVFAENPESLLINTRDGVPVTSVFLTILDCRAHPVGGAHAHFLETNVLKWRETAMRNAP